MKILFWLVFVINVIFAGVSGYNCCMASDSAEVQEAKPLNPDSIRIISADAKADSAKDKPAEKTGHAEKHDAKHAKTR